MKGVVWTDQIVETFLQIMKEHPNLMYKEIAQMMSDIFNMSFTKNSLIGKARRLKINGEGRADEPITIYDLEWGMCKWPLGEVNDYPPYAYCGEPTGDLGCSWCREHRKRAWTKSYYSS